MGRWQTDLFRSPSFDGYQRVNGSVISIVSCFIFAFAPIGVKPQPKFPLLPAMPRCAPPSSCRRCSRWFQRPKAESGRRRSEARGQKSAVGGQGSEFNAETRRSQRTAEIGKQKFTRRWQHCFSTTPLSSAFSASLRYVRFGLSLVTSSPTGFHRRPSSRAIAHLDILSRNDNLTR